MGILFRHQVLFFWLLLPRQQVKRSLLSFVCVCQLFCHFKLAFLQDVDPFQRLAFAKYDLTFYVFLLFYEGKITTNFAICQLFKGWLQAKKCNLFSLDNAFDFFKRALIIVLAQSRKFTVHFCLYSGCTSALFLQSHVTKGFPIFQIGNFLVKLGIDAFILLIADCEFEIVQELWFFKRGQLFGGIFELTHAFELKTF